MSPLTRKLTFDIDKELYRFSIDSTLERQKAVSIAEALERDKITPLLRFPTRKHITLIADGLIRPITMRIIINTLAQ